MKQTLLFAIRLDQIAGLGRAAGEAQVVERLLVYREEADRRKIPENFPG